MGYDDLTKKVFVLEDYLPREDVEELYGAILRSLSRFKNKWDLVRFVHDFVAERQGESIATKVAWHITKHFEELFERGRYVDFYLPTLAGVELFEGLINANTGKSHSRAKTGQKVQLTLTSVFSRVQGVRA